MSNAAALYCLIACALLGATLLYAVVLILATLLYRETRVLVARMSEDKSKVNDGEPGR